MSLITSCPSCGTRFRVVADQLRISEGWVRCGRCQEVFDAHETLGDALQVPTQNTPSAPDQHLDAADLKTSAAAERQAIAPPSVPSSVPPAVRDYPAAPYLDEVEVASATTDWASQGYELPVPSEAELEGEHDWQPEGPDTPSLLQSLPPAAEDWLAAPLHDPESATFPRKPVEPVRDAPEMGGVAMPAATPLPRWEPGEALPAEDAQALQWAQSWEAKTSASRADAEVSTAALPVETAASSVTEAAPDAQYDADMHGHVEGEAVPSFVRQAQRKAWWNKPAVRFAMGMLVTLLPLALLLQIVIHERNNLVAWKPQWLPAFQSMCVALRCEIAPRRHIASVVLTGSSFNEDAQPQHYRLGLSIQNQSAASVATPAVELTLTDTQGQTLVRKVLTPQDIGAPEELAAHSEWTGHLPVATQGLHLPVSGYRVLAFYP